MWLPSMERRRWYWRVKTKLREKDIDEFLLKLSKFSEHYIIYKEYRIVGAVAGMTVSKEVEQYAEKRGLFVFTQTNDGSTAIANSKDFVPHVYLT